MGPSWGYHWANIDILRVLNVEVFGKLRCDSLENFVESTQTAHGMIAQFALEHFRRRKPRVSAVSLCHDSFTAKAFLCVPLRLRAFAVKHCATLPTELLLV